MNCKIEGRSCLFAEWYLYDVLSHLPPDQDVSHSAWVFYVCVRFPSRLCRSFVGVCMTYMICMRCLPSGQEFVAI